MKSFKMVLMALALSSSAVMGQDYYAPTDKEKEPVARFPLEPLKIKTRDNGKKFIEYKLPVALTGELNTIIATAVDIPDMPNSVQVFEGKYATIACMGTDEKPGCMVTHRDLKLDLDAAIREINKTHFDPVSRENASIVAKDFQNPVEHSGNQPIGVLGGLKQPDSPQSIAPIPQGFMKTQFDRNKTVTELWIDWTNLLVFSEGQTTQIGNLSSLVVTGNRVVGYWTVHGKRGWFEFNLNSKKTGFDGTYSDGAAGTARIGHWRSVTR